MFTVVRHSRAFKFYQLNIGQAVSGTTSLIGSTADRLLSVPAHRFLKK